MKPLEKVMEEILKSFGAEGTFTLWAHELAHDGQGWSSNDRWKILTEGTFNEAVAAARGRWEIFKLNYSYRARVKDIDCDEVYDNRCSITSDYLAFLDVEFHPEPKS